MNWKQTLNPWGYARGLADQLESEKVVCKAFAEELKATRQLLNKERRLCDHAARDNASLKTELATALDALRIAEDRANRNEAALRVSSKIAIAKFEPVNTDTRRTKAKTPAQVGADAAREAEKHVAKAYQERDARGKFKARS